MHFEQQKSLNFISHTPQNNVKCVTVQLLNSLHCNFPSKISGLYDFTPYFFVRNSPNCVCTASLTCATVCVSAGQSSLAVGASDGKVNSSDIRHTHTHTLSLSLSYTYYIDIHTHTNTHTHLDSMTQLRLLDMSPGGHYRCLLECEVWGERRRYLTKQQRWREEEEEEEEGTVEDGSALLALHLWHTSQAQGAGDCSHVRYRPQLWLPFSLFSLSLCFLSLSLSLSPSLHSSPPSTNSSEVLRQTRSLVVIGHTCLLTFDPKTLQVTGCLDFRGEGIIMCTVSLDNM